MSKLWKDFISDTGMIQQKLGDGGDTAQRMGMYHIGQALRVDLGLEIFSDKTNAGIRRPVQALNFLECPKEVGNYRRTDDESQRHSACDRLTRDQATGIGSLMLAGTLMGQVKLARQHCRSFSWNMLKRGWFTNNKTWHGHEKDHPKVGTSRRDFGGFSLMGMCIRTLNWWLLWPLLCVFDSELIFSALKYRYWNDSDDILNHVTRCCIAGNVLPTPTAWLANKINDPYSLGTKLIIYFDRTFQYGAGVIDTGPPMYTVYDEEFLTKVMG